MKTLLIGILLLLLGTDMYGQTFCLRLMEESNDGNNLIVRIDMQGSADFSLGSGNLQFSYNTSAFDDPVFESSPLAPPFYQIPTVTIFPATGEVSFNIELAFAGFGTTIAGGSDWTEIGQINFPIVDDSDLGEMEWSYNGGTTQTVVFLDDEATQIFATSTPCLLPITITSLPIELKSFNVYKRSKTSVLNWITSSEINNKGFEILRSRDAINWDKIGWEEGQGTTINKTNYEFIDDQPLLGNNYYKLKQIDFNGDIDYSPVRELNYSKEVGLKVFPNPTKRNFQISLSSNGEEGTVWVYNIHGKQVIKEGLKSTNYNAEHLPTGIYTIMVNVNDQWFQEKLVIQY